jgi:hypothetical protein
MHGHDVGGIAQYDLVCQSMFGQQRGQFLGAAMQHDLRSLILFQKQRKARNDCCRPIIAAHGVDRQNARTIHTCQGRPCFGHGCDFLFVLLAQ